jgi:hypothetical protein
MEPEERKKKKGRNTIWKTNSREDEEMVKNQVQGKKYSGIKRNLQAVGVSWEVGEKGPIVTNVSV